MKIVPLSEVKGEALEDTFQEEIRFWKNELFWDYQPAVALIKKYMSSESLSGWAVQEDSGDFLGYLYYVINRPVAYIGNIFIRSGTADLDLYAQLVDKVLDSFASDESLGRIESQIFAFNCNLVPLFERHGFTVMKRHFLSLPTAELCSVEQGNHHSEYRVVQWDKKFFYQAAEVIHDGYLGSPDHELCYDYQSRQGCIRLLHNLVDNPGCGSFSPATSLVALDVEDMVCAVMVTSKISPQTGMIPQISVRKDCQRKGLGSFLLRNYFLEAKKSALEHVALSVTEANENACQLYFRLGFRRTKDFYAFVKGLC